MANDELTEDGEVKDSEWVGETDEYKAEKSLHHSSTLRDPVTPAYGVELPATEADKHARAIRLETYGPGEWESMPRVRVRKVDAEPQRLVDAVRALDATHAEAGRVLADAARKLRDAQLAYEAAGKDYKFALEQFNQTVAPLSR